MTASHRCPMSFLDLPPDTLYPPDHLPWGVVRVPKALRPRIVVRLGDHALDLAVFAATHGGLPEEVRHALTQETLNCLMDLGPDAWHTVRSALQGFLREPDGDEGLRGRLVHALADVTPCVPAVIGDYTDFYSSREHATNVGVMFRGRDNALQPNWLHLPVGYHGRASSIVPSGHAVRRPHGQLKPPEGDPVFGPSKELDFELEMGAFIGPGNALGTPIPVDAAERHVFGLCLVNDWSARDVQRWEYVPLGPFLAKNFLTTISPWIVSLEALAPVRVAAPPQESGVLPYLREARRTTFDVTLEAHLKTARLEAPVRIARTNYRYLYWTLAQQIAHHTSGGCNLRAGDLLASGTISGPDEDSYGSLLELAWKGTKPLALPSGETRCWLEDGDTLTLTGYATLPDGRRLGFGEATGTVEAA